MITKNEVNYEVEINENFGDTYIVHVRGSFLGFSASVAHPNNGRPTEQGIEILKDIIYGEITDRYKIEVLGRDESEVRGGKLDILFL